MNHTYDLRLEESSTKTRILDSAEQLFAERGFDAASLRAITGKAGVNLAAVNYHFKSKEVLIREVLARRLSPLNRRRLEMLDQHEAKRGSRPVPIEDIVRSLVAPLFEQRDSLSGGRYIASLLGRLYSEPRLWKIFLEELGDTVSRFSAALRRALPHLSKGELFWRIHFAIGAMNHTLAGIHILEYQSDGACDVSDSEGTIERLTAFMSAGLQAPLPVRPTRGEGETW
jgi:AcrR family transcriptional regulator